jgi:tetratricopeptide (TPR) repeat protein
VNDEAPDRRSETQAYITWFEKFSPEATVRAKAQEKVDKLEEDYKLHIQFYYANAAWDKAISYEEKLNESDLDAWTCYRLAKAYDKTQRMEIALEWYAKAIDKMPLHTDFIAEYANALLRAKRVTESSKMAEKAIKMQGTHVWALTTYGACKTLESNFGLAKKSLLTAISLDPDYAEARLYLSELYSRIGDKVQADLQLKEATRISQRKTK